MPVALQPREYEVFTVVPVKKLSNGISIAPIGLVKMLNSGGAIKELRYSSSDISTVEMKMCGSGTVGVYSSVMPKRIQVDSEEVMFVYEERTGLFSFNLQMPFKELYLWDILMEF
jgi:raffinose synthase